MDTQEALTGSGNSKLHKYQALVVGEKGVWSLIKYELITLFSSWIPGALGLLLRSKLYPVLLGSTGRGGVFGCNVVLRHPGKLRLKSNIVIDDNGVLEVHRATLVFGQPPVVQHLQQYV